MTYKLNEIDHQLIDLALKEDLNVPFCDVTTQTLCPAGISGAVKILSKEKRPIVICGIPVVKAILNKFKNPIHVQTDYQDGELVTPEEKIISLFGDIKTILMVERTLLNFLRHLSAIATLTKQFVDQVKSFNIKILDTRKTTPGLRHLEKYAVFCGGGVNHRQGLYDAIMIKDTHIDLLGGIPTALEKLPKQNKLPVIIEVRNLAELDSVIQHGQHKVHRILLDNMSSPLLIQCVTKCHGIFETEASGNITLNNIEQIAASGVNYISVGCLTYAAGQVDLSMCAE